MKNLVLFFLLALFGFVLASTGYEGYERNENVGDLVGNIINKTINDIVKNMSDPMTIKSISLEFNDTTILSGGANITKATLGGLSALVASTIDVSILSETLKMKLEIPDLLIAFNYWLDVVVADLVPLYGSGSNFVKLDSIALNISGGLNMTGGMHVQGISLIPSIGSATFNFNGLIDDPEFSALVNTILDDTFCDFISNNAEIISKVLSLPIQKIINDALKYNDTLHGLFNEIDYEVYV